MTTLRLVLRPAAQADIAEATEWYARKRIELAIEFATAVRSCFARILEHPERYSLVHRDVRRAFVGRFPYLVFFRLQAEEVVVVAVLHGARRPATWKRRR